MIYYLYGEFNTLQEKRITNKSSVILAKKIIDVIAEKIKKLKIYYTTY